MKSTSDLLERRPAQPSTEAGRAELRGEGDLQLLHPGREHRQAGRVPDPGGAQREGQVRSRQVLDVQGTLQELRRHIPVSFFTAKPGLTFMINDD